MESSMVASGRGHQESISKWIISKTTFPVWQKIKQLMDCYCKLHISVFFFLYSKNMGLWEPFLSISFGRGRQEQHKTNPSSGETWIFHYRPPQPSGHTTYQYTAPALGVHYQYTAPALLGWRTAHLQWQTRKGRPTRKRWCCESFSDMQSEAHFAHLVNRKRKALSNSELNFRTWCLN